MHDDNGRPWETGDERWEGGGDRQYTRGIQLTRMELCGATSELRSPFNNEDDHTAIVSMQGDWVCDWIG